MTVSVTLQFSDVAAAAHALARLVPADLFGVAISALPGTPPAAVPTAGFLQTGETYIAHADRPDVGATVMLAPPANLPPLSTSPTPHQVVPVAPAALDPAAVFGGAVAPAAPTAPALAPAAGPAISPPTVGTSPTVAPATGERDSTGLIWDARIHAGSKTRVASGAWTAKRNVDPAFKAQVEADLRGVAAPAAAAPAAPVAPVAPAAPTLIAPAAPAAPTAETFASYMARVGGIYTARPVDSHNLMAQALAPHGLQHVGQLASRPDLIPAVDAAFKALLAA